MNKIDELNNLASLSHIDVIGVTETYLRDEFKDHEVRLPCCVRFHQDRPTSKRGGVALSVKPNLRLQLMAPLPLFVSFIACKTPKQL